MYVRLVVFQASMYFSMQDERQVCSFDESEVEGLGIQVAKQFLGCGVSQGPVKRGGETSVR